jgi:hypothetical protein
MTHWASRKTQITRNEAHALKEAVQATREHRGGNYTFNELLNSWILFVNEVERGYDDSIYEYRNDLSVRDILAEIVERSPPDLRQKLDELLDSWDTRFVSATKPSKRPLASRPDVRNVAWWNRVPIVLTSELETDLLADDIV